PLRLRPHGPRRLLRHRRPRHGLPPHPRGAGTHRLTCAFPDRVNGTGGPPPVPFRHAVLGDAPKETAMSALTVSQDPEQSWDDLVRFWEEMEWPEGSRVEIIEGIVTVSPAPAFRHNLIAESIQRRLYSVISEDMGSSPSRPSAVPPRLATLFPARVVAPRREHTESDPHTPAAMAELVVEVTSKSNARHDRVSKPAAYAAAGIPLFLLVDRWAPDGPAATLYGDPKGDVYRPLLTAKFGEPLILPAPFDLVIDTAEFPAP